MLRTESEAEHRVDAVVMFIGESPELRDVRDWARRQGIRQVDRLDGSEPVCAVADEDVLDGRCDAEQAELMQEVRKRGIRCIPPSQARTELGA